MKILIAGAGVIGLSCAWRLAKQGVQVVVVDPRSAAHGATLAALGALWPASPLANGPLQTFHRASLWQFESFAKELAAETQLPISFKRLGRMEILNSIKANARAKEEALAAQRDWPAFAAPAPTMEVLDFPQASQINRGIAPFNYGVLHCHATAQVNVVELVAALEKACRGREVQFHFGASLTSITSPFQTTAGPMSADALLLATGAWSSQLLAPSGKLPADGGGPGADGRAIMPAKGQGLALAAPSSHSLKTILKSGKIYLVPWETEILVGSTTEPEAGFDESPTSEGREKLLAGAIALFPELKASKLLRHWAGLRPDSADDLPIMGPLPAIPNVFICAGHYKTGLGLAPRVSDLMARTILKKNIPPELVAFLPRNSILV
ncbi:MAG: FAD-dependent oxidoreductase [Phycisphaerales bacterium]|nr:FAD-dependent oxidoreductase [Phycisphaerales bacterium]